MLRVLLFAAAAVCLVGSACAQDCSWTEPTTGHVYDFSSMRKTSDYTAKDPDYNYVFNPCGNAIESLCSAADGSMCQEQPQKLVAMLATWTATSGPKYSLINAKKPAAGVQLVFNNGDTQNCGAPRTVIMNITCGESDGSFTLAEDPNIKCTYDAAMTHPVACIGSVPGAGGLSGGWIFIIIVCVTSIVYVAAGCIYKNKKLQTSGMESCPQIEFWRELPGLCKEGVSFTIAKIKSCTNRGGNNQPSGGFDEI